MINLDAGNSNIQLKGMIREQAEAKRMEGNDLFKAKQYEQAVVCYSAAIDLTPESLTDQDAQVMRVEGLSRFVGAPASKKRKRKRRGDSVSLPARLFKSLPC